MESPCNRQRPKVGEDSPPVETEFVPAPPGPLPWVRESPNFDTLRERRRAWEEKGEIERKIRAAWIRAEIERATGSVSAAPVQWPQAVWSPFPVERSGYLRVAGGSDPVAMEGFDVVPGSFVPVADHAAATEPGIVIGVGEVELPPRFVGYPESGNKETAP